MQLLTITLDRRRPRPGRRLRVRSFKVSSTNRPSHSSVASLAVSTTTRTVPKLSGRRRRPSNSLASLCVWERERVDLCDDCKKAWNGEYEPGRRLGRHVSSLCRAQCIVSSKPQLPAPPQQQVAAKGPECENIAVRGVLPRRVKGRINGWANSLCRGG